MVVRFVDIGGTLAPKYFYIIWLSNHLTDDSKNTSNKLDTSIFSFIFIHIQQPNTRPIM